ncbi:MAG: hypothetical protein RLZZ403_1522 [Pseudomonadota bacterium]|jgi:uncharacterized protein YdhG (YjbR/CyaY superfamily)
MATARVTYPSIDDYIAASPAAVQPVLRKIRSVIRKAAPDAEETISYQMPAFRQHGILLYFAAFKNHIGLYPPVRGDVQLERAVGPYAGQKGNLRFPLDQPMPFELIERIARFRVRQDLASAEAQRRKRPSP